MKFDSRITMHLWPGTDVFANPVTIKNEPMLFNCDLLHAWQYGGPITRSFIKAMPSDWARRDVVIDSKVAMLKPGFMPCIGGWHHDDVYRPVIDGKEGQPDYENMRYRSQHLTALVCSELAPTEFAIGTHTLPRVTEGVVYDEWDKRVTEQVEAGELELVKARDGHIYEFDWQTMHRGVPATGNGWRWWIRVSRNTWRTDRVTNEIRSQVQVYLKDLSAGW